MKKTVTIVLAMLLAVALLAGCATASPSPTGTSPSPTTSGSAAPSAKTTVDKPVSIGLLDSNTAGTAGYDYFKAWLEKYNTDTKNVTIEHEGMTSNDARQKQLVSAAANALPDIFWSYTNYCTDFMKDGQIIDWKTVVDDPRWPEFKENFPESAWQGTSYLGCPYEAAISCLYYNQTMFKEYGWEVPKTYSDLLALGAKAKEKKVTLITNSGKENRFAWLCGVMWSRTTTVENARKVVSDPINNRYDDPKNGFIAVLDHFKGMLDAGCYDLDQMGVSRADSYAAFATGKAAMFFEGAWVPNNLVAASSREWVNEHIRGTTYITFDDVKGETSSEAHVGGPLSFFAANSKLPQDEDKYVAAMDFMVAFSGPEFREGKFKIDGAPYAGNAQKDWDISKELQVSQTFLGFLASAKEFTLCMDVWAPAPVDASIKTEAFPGLVTGSYKTGAEAVVPVQRAAEAYVNTKK